jgi:hypothetical protein
MKFSTKVATLEDGVKEVAVRADDGKPLLVTLKGAQVVSVDDEVLLKVDDETVAQCEDAVLTKAKESKVAWFGKEIADSRLESAFTSSFSTDENILSVHRAEVVRVYDAKRELVEDKELAKDDVVDVVVQLRSVQFLQKSFETEWVLHQAKFKAEPKPKKEVVNFSDCLFESDDEGEEEEDEFF